MSGTGPGGGFEEIDDPLERLERNERSGRQALVFVLASAAAVLLCAVAVGLLVDVAGPRCAEGPQLCTTAGRVEIVAVPTAVSFGLACLCLWQTYRRWRDHVRWRPWLFASQLMWLGTTAYLLVSSSIVFAAR